MTILGNGSGGDGQTGGSQGQSAGNPGGDGSGAAGGTAGGTAGGDGGGTSGGQPWYESLSADVKSNGAIRQFKDVESLAKSYIHANAKISQKGVIVPGEKAPDEEWQGFFKSIGVPELDKYEIKAPEGKVQPEMLTKLKETAHKLGVLPKQAQALLEFQLKAQEEAQTTATKQFQTKIQADIEGLRKEWGDGFGKQVAFAKAAARELGGEETVAHLDKTGLGNDAVLIKLLAKAGALLGEDKIRGEGGTTFGKTPAEIVREHEEMQGKLWGMAPSDPQYATVSKRVEDLAQLRWPAKK